jgi:hypothetical protein
MPEKNFTIFTGIGAIGKSTLLFSIAELLKIDLGLKMAFIGWTHEFSELHISETIKKSFDFVRFLSDSKEENLKMLELVSELAVRDRYDYIFIDDIGGAPNLEQRLNKSINYKISPGSIIAFSEDQQTYIDRILEIPVSKIATYTFREIFSPDSDIKNKFVGFSVHKVEYGKRWDFNYKISVDGIDSQEFVKSFVRDVKISRIIEKK